MIARRQWRSRRIGDRQRRYWEVRQKNDGKPHMAKTNLAMEWVCSWWLHAGLTKIKLFEISFCVSFGKVVIVSFWKIPVAVTWLPPDRNNSILVHVVEVKHKLNVVTNSHERGRNVTILSTASRREQTIQFVRKRNNNCNTRSQTHKLADSNERVRDCPCQSANSRMSHVC